MESQDKNAGENQEPKKEDQEMKKEGEAAKEVEAKPRNIQYDSKKWDEIMKQEEDDERIEDAAKKDTPVVAKVLSLE